MKPYTVKSDRHEPTTLKASSARVAVNEYLRYVERRNGKTLKAPFTVQVQEAIEQC